MYRLLFATAALLATIPASAAPMEVAADTRVGFDITHWRLSTVSGSFSDIHGVVDWDPAQPQLTTAAITIPIASVDTHNADRDAHLRQAEIFDARRFPTAVFTSTEVRDIGEQGFDLVGTLEMKGVTQPVTLHVTDVQAGRAKATATLDRFAWGVTYGNSLVETGAIAIGQAVTLSIDLVLKPFEVEPGS